MPDSESTGHRRAELCVRSDLPTPTRKRWRAVARALDALVADGILAERSVIEWAKRVPVHGGPGADERDRYRAFSAWASDAGVRLAPFFDTRLCYSTTSGERRAELVLPAMCLAVYEDDDLVFVAPHADTNATVSVEDGIERLRESAVGREAIRRLTVAD